MTMQDPISDMLTRIRNAQKVGKPEVVIPYSKMKLEITKLLKNEGYISGFALKDEGTAQGQIIISLKYQEGIPVIETLRRISRPSLRVYRGKDELPKVMNGLGVAVVSTSKGIMSDRMARKLGEGGEVLFYVS